MEVYGGAHRVVIKGNWKIHAENFIGDGYRSLPEGAKVTYEEEQGDKGPKAVNVQKV